jgi:hypothetical protein
MRVLVVTTWFPSPLSQIDGIFNFRDVQLLKNDNELEIIHLVKGNASLHNSQEYIDGVVITRLLFDLKHPFKTIQALIKIREDSNSVDLIHTMAFPALLPVWFSQLLNTRRVPWVHTEHWSGLLLRDENHFFEILKSLNKLLLKAPNKVVSVGQNIANVIYSFRRDKIEIIASASRLAILYRPRNFLDRGL